MFWTPFKLQTLEFALVLFSLGAGFFLRSPGSLLSSILNLLFLTSLSHSMWTLFLGMELGLVSSESLWALNCSVPSELTISPMHASVLGMFKAPLSFCFCSQIGPLSLPASPCQLVGYFLVGMKPGCVFPLLFLADAIQLL